MPTATWPAVVRTAPSGTMKIVYPGCNNRSEFTYGALSRCVNMIHYSWYDTGLIANRAKDMYIAYSGANRTCQTPSAIEAFMHDWTRDAHGLADSVARHAGLKVQLKYLLDVAHCNSLSLHGISFPLNQSTTRIPPCRALNSNML